MRPGISLYRGSGTHDDDWSDHNASRHERRGGFPGTVREQFA
jgi:hypothetical protein